MNYFDEIPRLHSIQYLYFLLMKYRFLSSLLLSLNLFSDITTSSSCSFDHNSFPISSFDIHILHFISFTAPFWPPPLQMFVFDKIEGGEISTHQFEVTGSKYAPEGEVYKNGKIVKSSEYEGLVELANICAMCNDSSVDYNEVRRSIFRRI